MTTHLSVRVKPHLFMPGETVVAAIKKYNLHDVTRDEQKLLLKQFKEINTDTVPRAGTRAMIPILSRHYEQVFKKPV